MSGEIQTTFGCKYFRQRIHWLTSVVRIDGWHRTHHYVDLILQLISVATNVDSEMVERDQKVIPVVWLPEVFAFVNEPGYIEFIKFCG